MSDRTLQQPGIAGYRPTRLGYAGCFPDAIVRPVGWGACEKRLRHEGEPACPGFGILGARTFPAGRSRG